LAAPALVLALGGSGRAGQPKPGKKAAKLHWRLPREMPGAAGSSRYGMLPFDSIRVKGWLCFSAFSGADGQAGFWVRAPGADWNDISGAGESRRMSRWIRFGDRAAVLSGGRHGVHITTFAPEAEAEKRVATHDVRVPAASKDAFRSYHRYYDVYSLDLAAHGERLFALYSLQEYRSGARSYVIQVRSSGDGGKTWDKPHDFTSSSRHFSSGSSGAIWSDGEKLHVIFMPPQPGPSGKPKLQHRLSTDGGKSWKAAAALPAPAAGKTLGSLRCCRSEGKEVWLLASDVTGSGGRVYLYRSSDGGEKWAKPLRIGKVTAPNANAGPLDGCHLAIGKELLAFGYGALSAKHKYDHKTGRSSYTYSASGGLLVSRNGGASWKAESYAAGLKGRSYAPVPAVRSDGGLDLVFGWTDGSGALKMLSRDARPSPPPEQAAKVKAGIAKMIAELADKDYRVRERATARLKLMGMAVLPALRRASRDRDAERSLTAEDLLRKMTPTWWKGP
jgi:hypothetical protein